MFCTSCQLNLFSLAWLQWTQPSWSNTTYSFLCIILSKNLFDYSWQQTGEQQNMCRNRLPGTPDYFTEGMKKSLKTDQNRTTQSFLAKLVWVSVSDFCPLVSIHLNCFKGSCKARSVEATAYGPGLHSLSCNSETLIYSHEHWILHSILAKCLIII